MRRIHASTKSGHLRTRAARVVAAAAAAAASVFALAQAAEAQAQELPPQVRFVTVFDPDGPGPDDPGKPKSHLIQTPAPYALDVDGERDPFPALLGVAPGYELVAQVTGSNTQPEISIEKTSSAPARLPVRIELLDGAGKAKQTIGYDTLRSTAPAGFVASLDLSDSDGDPETTEALVDLQIESPGERLALVHERFEGAPGERREREIARIEYRRQGAGTRVPTSARVDFSQTADGNALTLTRPAGQRTVVDLLSSQPGNDPKVSATVAELPQRLSVTVEDSTQHQHVSYSASDPVGRIAAEIEYLAGSSGANRRRLDATITGVPRSFAVEHDGEAKTLDYTASARVPSIVVYQRPVRRRAVVHSPGMTIPCSQPVAGSARAGRRSSHTRAAGCATPGPTYLEVALEDAPTGVEAGYGGPLRIAGSRRSSYPNLHPGGPDTYIPCQAPISDGDYPAASSAEGDCSEGHTPAASLDRIGRLVVRGQSFPIARRLALPGVPAPCVLPPTLRGAAAAGSNARACGPLVQDPDLDGVQLNQEEDEYFLVARMRDLRLAEVTVPAPVAADRCPVGELLLDVQPGEAAHPIAAYFRTPRRTGGMQTLRATADTLPPRARLQFEEFASSCGIGYTANGSVPHVEIHGSNLDGLPRRARELHVWLDDVPRVLGFERGRRDSRLAVHASPADSLGRLEAQLTSGPDWRLPESEERPDGSTRYLDGLYQRDISRGYVVFGRLSGLFDLAVASGRAADGARTTDVRLDAEGAAGVETALRVDSRTPARRRLRVKDEVYSGTESTLATLDPLPRDVRLATAERDDMLRARYGADEAADLLNVAKRVRYPGYGPYREDVDASFVEVPTSLAICKGTEGPECDQEELFRKSKADISFGIHASERTEMSFESRTSRVPAKRDIYDRVAAQLSVRELVIQSRVYKTGGWNPFDYVKSESGYIGIHTGWDGGRDVDTGEPYENATLSGWIRSWIDDADAWHPGNELPESAREHFGEDVIKANELIFPAGFAAERRLAQWAQEADGMLNTYGDVECPGGTEIRGWRWTMTGFGYSDSSHEFCTGDINNWPDP